MARKACKENVPERFREVFPDARECGDGEYRNDSYTVMLFQADKEEVLNTPLDKFDKEVTGFLRTKYTPTEGDPTMTVDILNGGKSIQTFTEDYLTSICDVLGVSLKDLHSKYTIRTKGWGFQPVLIEGEEWSAMVAPLVNLTPGRAVERTDERVEIEK